MPPALLHEDLGWAMREPTFAAANELVHGIQKKDARSVIYCQSPAWQSASQRIPGMVSIAGLAGGPPMQSDSFKEERGGDFIDSNPGSIQTLAIILQSIHN